MKGKRGYDIIGLMSGTSFDGLDLAFCRFFRYRNKWHYRILRADTYSYSREWTEKLHHAVHLDALSFIQLHKEYGRYLGQSVKKFLGTGPEPDLISSHGHTVFHRPESELTFQIGDGACIAAVCGTTTVSDFRGLDMAHGGQGAPLVPVGDELLFDEYDCCLNLGGFANISYKKDGHRVAFDICPVNLILNRLAAEKGFDFDRNGQMGRKGKANNNLVRNLNNIPYYSLRGPRSLGREWLEKHFMPVIDSFDLSAEDKLRSVYEHINQQISECLSCLDSPLVLLTGGGAFNRFLTERLQNAAARIVVPDKILVKYKEALIFALLGLLRYRNETNCIASVTGSSRDLKTGIIHVI